MLKYFHLLSIPSHVAGGKLVPFLCATLRMRYPINNCTRDTTAMTLGSPDMRQGPADVTARRSLRLSENKHPIHGDVWKGHPRQFKRQSAWPLCVCNVWWVFVWRLGRGDYLRRFGLINEFVDLEVWFRTCFPSRCLVSGFVSSTGIGFGLDIIVCVCTLIWCHQWRPLCVRGFSTSWCAFVHSVATSTNALFCLFRKSRRHSFLECVWAVSWDRHRYCSGSGF